MQATAMRHMAARSPLTQTQLKAAAPSVFASTKSVKMSDSYTFVPTSLAVTALEKVGLVPVMATQRNTKGDALSARHMVRFAFLKEMNKTRNRGDVMTEVIVVNSHNGRTAFKLYYGLFRFICGNGLIVSDTTVNMTRRHIGDVKAIMDEVDEVLGRGDSVIKVVSGMKQFQLSEPQRRDFAANALKLRYSEQHRNGKEEMKSTIVPDQLLLPRRTEDQKTDLWTTFNVVQENLVIGGLTGKSASGRATHTRQLQDVRKLVAVNTDLWDLAQGTMKVTKGLPVLN